MKFARTIMQPHLVFLPLIILGFLCWLLPNRIIGIFSKSDLTFYTISVTVIWYSLIVFSCLLAKKASKTLVWQKNSNQNYSIYVYYLLTIVSVIGTVATFVSLGSLGLIMAAIRDQQVNQLKEALYSGYSAGVLTLRYTCALAGTYALYRLILLRRFGLLDLLNLLCVLMCAFLSARILLIQTGFFFVFVFLNQFDGRNVQIKIGKFKGIILGLMMVSVIVTFTYLRSAGTYKQELGYTNPVAVTGVELARYAGMPIQVTLGVSNLIAETDVIERMNIRLVYIAPTFFHPADIEGDNSGGVGQQWYLGYIDLPPTLTTNSAYAAMLGYLGYWSFFIMPLVCFVYSFIFFVLNSLKSLEARLTQAMILYAFFELWRLYFFSSGSFVFTTTLMLGVLLWQVLTGTISLRQRGLKVPRQHYSRRPMVKHR